MPRQQVYGKRSRAVYDPDAAFTSPEQPPKSTKPERNRPTTIRKAELQEDEQTGLRRSPRRALGTKHVNSVVLPLEALSVFQETKSRKSNARRKYEAVQPQERQTPNEADIHVKDDTPEGQTLPRRRLESRRSPTGRTPAQIPSPVRRRNAKPRIDDEGRIEGRGKHTMFDTMRAKGDQKALSESQVQNIVSPKLKRKPRGRLRGAEEEEVSQETEDYLIQNFPVKSVSEARATKEDLTSIVLPAVKDCPYKQHCCTLLDLSAHPMTSFQTWSEELSELFAVTKIAEASFGEVYRLSLLADLSDFETTDESVFKIIPITPSTNTLPSDKRKRNAALGRAEGMSAPSDIANEVRLLQRMSTIPGFTNFRDVRILQGRPPAAFISAFHVWNKEQKSKKKELSHFPDPSKKSSYDSNQLWAVIEMQDAGNDLERFVESGACTAIWTVWDIFWQTVLSIAKGEESAEFEHRDLHLGNICVRSPPESTYEVDTKQKLGFTSLETTIIDYTISRCLMPDSSIAYTDLSAPAQAPLFEGDSSEEYQYDIYRYMRGALYLDQPLAPDLHEIPTEDLQITTGRSWAQFHPQTNLVWLHLVLYKLLEQVSWPSANKASARLKKSEYARWKRAQDLEFILLKVQDLLDPNSICGNGIRSASDLVGFAVGEEWLDLEDVIGSGVDESALVSQLDALALE